jgi:hypothetical protein
MENERTVKFFIGTLLEREVLQVDLRPQEVTFIDALSNTTKLYRVDFAATVRTADGGAQKVLIEVQKAFHFTDLERFRGYLGEHYRKVDAGENDPLPIVTIYILGFSLPEIKSPCFKIGREYIDLFTHEPIPERSHFVERLTHDSYVVQTVRLPENHSKDKLHELLSLFEQRNFTNDEKTEKLYPYDPECEEIREMCQTLSNAIANPQTRKRLYGEIAYYRQRDDDARQARVELEKSQEIIVEKDHVIAEKDAALAAERAALAVALARITEMEQRNNNTK